VVDKSPRKYIATRWGALDRTKRCNKK